MGDQRPESMTIDHHCLTREEFELHYRLYRKWRSKDIEEEPEELEDSV